MRLFGIIAIILLAIAAAIIEDVNSGYEELQPYLEASRQMDAKLALDLEYQERQKKASLSLDVEYQESISRLADAMRQSAATGSLLDGEAARSFRIAHEEAYRSAGGAGFRMLCGGGSCEIEVRRPGHYTIYAQGRNGEATSRIVWD